MLVSLSAPKLGAKPFQGRHHYMVVGSSLPNLWYILTSAQIMEITCKHAADGTRNALMMRLLNLKMSSCVHRRKDHLHKMPACCRRSSS